MVRRLSLLNGLAILSVVASHAAGWGFIAMINWTDRYRPVAVPNYDQVGSLPYYALLATRCWASFAVPAFLFVSGFFVAYAAQGSQSALSWKTVRVRLQNLLVPYLVWSVVIFAGDALQGALYAPGHYLRGLVLGEAHPAYFYIPLICQFYLLSPWVVQVARTRVSWLLIGSGLLQLAVLCLRYVSVFGMDLPVLRQATDLLFPMYALFFVAGVASMFHIQLLSRWLNRAKWFLLVAAVVLGALNLWESELVYNLTGLRRGSGPTTIPASLYSAAFVLCWLAFSQVSIPFSKLLYGLGRASFGIYLLHPKVLEFVARATQKLVPRVLAYPLLFQLVLVASAIWGPLLLMAAVAKSPVRRAYRYLFG